MDHIQPFRSVGGGLHFKSFQLKDLLKQYPDIFCIIDDQYSFHWFHLPLLFHGVALHQWNGEGENGAPGLVVFVPDRAVVGGNNVFADGQPQTGAAQFRVVLIHLNVLVKDPLRILLRDPGSLVGDPDDEEVAGVEIGGNMDPIPCSGVLEGIGQQVVHDPDELILIGPDLRQRIGAAEGEGDVLLQGDPFELGNGLVDDIQDIAVFEQVYGLGGFCLRHLEHVGDQRREGEAVLQDCGHQLLLIFIQIADGGVLKKLCTHDDGGQGRFQLMGDGGEELVAGVFEFGFFLHHIVHGLQPHGNQTGREDPGDQRKGKESDAQNDQPIAQHLCDIRIQGPDRIRQIGLIGSHGGIYGGQLGQQGQPPVVIGFVFVSLRDLSVKDRKVIYIDIVGIEDLENIIDLFLSGRFIKFHLIVLLEFRRIRLERVVGGSVQIRQVLRDQESLGKEEIFHLFHVIDGIGGVFQGCPDLQGSVIVGKHDDQQINHDRSDSQKDQRGAFFSGHGSSPFGFRCGYIKSI